jgi:hypothetical protein
MRLASTRSSNALEIFLTATFSLVSAFSAELQEVYSSTVRPLTKTLNRHSSLHDHAIGATPYDLDKFVLFVDLEIGPCYNKRVRARPSWRRSDRRRGT